MLSLPLLNKIQQGDADAIKALKTAHEKDSFFDDRCSVFAKISTVSIRRVRRSRRRWKFVQRNCCVYESWIQTVYAFRCSSHMTF